MPMDFEAVYCVNESKASEGVWVNLVSGARIKVAKLGTVKYQNALMRHTRKYQAQIRVNRLDAETMNEITIKTLAECILLDWEDIEIGGKPFPYNQKNAVFLMTRSSDFRTDVENSANNMELFQDQVDLDADSKNLLTTSNGISSMEETSINSS